MLVRSVRPFWGKSNRVQWAALDSLVSRGPFITMCPLKNFSQQRQLNIATAVTTARVHSDGTSNLNTATVSSVLAMAAVTAAISMASTETHLEKNMSEVIYGNNNNHSKQIEEETDDLTTTILNWSGTHSITLPTSQFYEPETIQELEQIVHQCYVTNTPVRPVGSALSPNGIAFHHRHGNSGAAMISLVHLNQVLAVDKENMTVTVQAGARVSEVIEALRPHGLTLPNLASIAEQQIGGFIQVGAHGTGARIPPVDDFCNALKLLTTHMGTITLSNDPHATNPLFDLAKVGLGSLGIVTEVTLKCIPAHNLVEHTFLLTRKQARDQINSLLKRHKHVRYMWIPYQDAVVVVTNDPEEEEINKTETPKFASPLETSERKKYRYEPLTELLLRKNRTFNKEQVQQMGFGELRDQLLAIDPLNIEHVKLCNEAEAEFWRRTQGRQVKPSDELLQFDCGGQQWVWEICFPTGCFDKNNGNDMTFMEELLQGIERHGGVIAAHAPIEQRWTASSSSLMSPAYSTKKDDLYCWVGIIMYLPTSDERQCEDISCTFRQDYCNLMKRVGEKVNAVSHWAKLEIPNSPKGVHELQQHIRSRYPVDYFNFARKTLDPTNLLSNDLINAIFGNSTNASDHVSADAATSSETH